MGIAIFRPPSMLLYKSTVSVNEIPDRKKSYRTVYPSELGDGGIKKIVMLSLIQVRVPC